MPRVTTLGIVALLALATTVWADQIVFDNGNTLTGTVESADNGQLKIKTDVAGEVTVNLKDVKSISTEHPLQIRLTNNQIVHAPLAPSTQPNKAVIAGQTISLDQIKRITPKSAWNGSVMVNGDLERGNTHAENLGVTADATLRRDDEWHNDRFSLSAAYNYGRSRQNGADVTSADNWFAQAKYDRFFTDKLYGYAMMRYDHDRLAFLNYRLSPGAGLGYQWVESAGFNFSTEAGVSYVYEDYSNDGTDDRVALRLAYHLTKQLNDSVSAFNDVEWLPAFSNPADYNLNADAGIRAKLTGSLFSEFKILYQRDSTPAPGAQKDDLKFILGVGLQF